MGGRGAEAVVTSLLRQIPVPEGGTPDVAS
jgi:hypothetical protein